jgi:hypothetical protein
MQTLMTQQSLARIGAVCAILGAVVQVGAGILSSTAFGGVPTGAEASVLLAAMASQPLWLWSIMQLGFVVGPVLWVIAYIALAALLIQGWPGALAKVAAAAIVVGSAPHIISSTVNGFALPALAQAWQGAAGAEQANLALMWNGLLYLIDGTWAVSITLFHGLPFVLSGLAVVMSRRFSAFAGWIGVVGGMGSIIAGPMMYFRMEGLPIGLSIISAVVISIYMIVLGLMMWNASPVEA